MGKYIGHECLLTHGRLRQHSVQTGYLANKKSYSEFSCTAFDLRDRSESSPRLKQAY